MLSSRLLVLSCQRVRRLVVAEYRNQCNIDDLLFDRSPVRCFALPVPGIALFQAFAPLSRILRLAACVSTSPRALPTPGHRLCPAGGSLQYSFALPVSASSSHLESLEAPRSRKACHHMLFSCPPALLPRPPVSRVRLSRARPSRAFPVRAPPCAVVRLRPRAACAFLTQPAAFAHLCPRAGRS